MIEGEYFLKTRRMNFFPKNSQFFEQLEKLVSVVHEGGTILSRTDLNDKNIVNIAREARKLELFADSLCQKIYQDADTTFITPIDREDMHLLVHSLDNIIDFIENVLSRLALYQVEENIEEYAVLKSLVGKSTGHLYELIGLLKNKGKYIEAMKKLIIEIHNLENEGDVFIQQAFAKLFSNHHEPLTIIKWKDLLEDMENVLDECENTADLVNKVVIKNF